MNARLTRKEMKTDEVRMAFDHFVIFIREQWRPIAIGAGIVAALLLVALAFLGLRSAREGRAQERLARAIQIYSAPIDLVAPRPEDEADPSFSTESERAAAASGVLESLVEDYGSSGAAAVARAYLAQMATVSGGLSEARASWEALARESRGTALGAAVELNLVRLDRREGRLAELAQRLEQGLEEQRTALPTDVLLYELATTLSELGDEDRAQSLLQRLVEEHTESPLWAEAQDKLSSAG